MSIKALLGCAVAFAAAGYVANTYLYLPVSADNPATGIARGKLIFPVRKIVQLIRAADWKQPNGIRFE